MPSQTIVKPYGSQENDWSYAAAGGGILNSATAVTIAPSVAGLRNFLTHMNIMAEALTNATEIVVRDNTTGTVLWRSKITTAGIPNGINIDFPTPLKSSPGNTLGFGCLTASGAGAVYVNAQGYTQ